MKTSEVVMELIKNDSTERAVYVTLFVRDEEGRVISKKRYPVSAVFSHRQHETSIYIEQADELDA